MSSEIRAMTLAEILDQSFGLLRSHFTPLVGIAMVFIVPSSLIQDLFMRMEPGEIPGATFWTAWGLVMLLALVGMPWSQLAITLSVSDAMLGREVSIGKAYGSTLSRYPAYLGTFLLVGLGVIVGLMLLVVPGIYLIGIWILVGPVVVIESVSGPRAMGRSRDLVRGNWWRAIGIVLVATILTSIVGGGFNLLFGFIPIVGGLLSGVVQSIVFAFTSAVMVCLYFDLRCRHEDFDLQVLAQQVAGSGAAEPYAT